MRLEPLAERGHRPVRDARREHGVVPRVAGARAAGAVEVRLLRVEEEQVLWKKSRGGRSEEEAYG